MKFLAPCILAALLLVTGRADAGTQDVTAKQFRQVKVHMTRAHVQHDIFNGVTGVRIDRWTDDRDRTHLIREYHERDGRFIDLTYVRAATDGARFRVVRIERYLP